MKNHSPIRFGSLALGALLGSATALPAAVVIDQFLTPDSGHGVTIANGIVGTTQNLVQTGLDSVLGGSRGLFLQIQAIYDDANLATASVNGLTSADQFALANSPNVESSCTITWDANGAGLNTNLGMDDQFRLLNVYNEISIAYTITMQTFGGGISTHTVQTGTNFEGYLSFPFSGFTGDADLADIDRISLSFGSGRSADVSIGSVVAIPEPTSAGLLTLAGLALLARRRR
jgi:hypothetical protein